MLNKLKDKGYWVAKHYYWQSMLHYIYYSVKFRSFTYFSVANPAIIYGGMLEDKKSDIYDLLPQDLVPTTKVCTTIDGAIEFLKESGLDYPIIAKPNIGLKGMEVEKVHSQEALEQLFATDTKNREWILQEFLDDPCEYSILFYKCPTSGEYGITSFIEKVYPQEVADGIHTYRKIIAECKNPFLKKATVRRRFSDRLDTVPPKGTKITLDEIGNYSRGASFYSKMHEVDQAMVTTYYNQYRDQTDINFFRIDCKAKSMEEVKAGKYKILEVNGMKSEPLHIYDPKYSFSDIRKEIISHWKTIEKVSREQMTIIGETPSLIEGLKSYRSLKKAFK